MILLRSRLKVADNTGAKEVSCIGVIGKKNKRSASLGDVITASVKVSAGAGFVYLLTGKIMTMPGLGSMPSYLNTDIDEQGDIVGLF